MVKKSELDEEIDEIVSMWDSGDYDNLKDAIMDCRSLLESIPSKAADKRKTVERVLMEATTQAQELADEDPEMGDYLAGLIDPSWLSPKYLASQAKKKSAPAKAKKTSVPAKKTKKK